MAVYELSYFFKHFDLCRVLSEKCRFFLLKLSAEQVLMNHQGDCDEIRRLMVFHTVMMLHVAGSLQQILTFRI